MARPAKPVSVSSKHFTKEERNEREAIEKRIRGGKTKVICPSNLQPNQKRIFKRIVKELSGSDILGSLDTYLLSTAAICIDRMHFIEAQINEHPDMLMSSPLMNALKKYTDMFFRCCNELGLSPQSRAKFANLMAAKAEDPLIAALTLDDDDDEDDED